MKTISALLFSLIFIISPAGANTKKLPNYKIPNGKYESINSANNNYIINKYDFNSKTKRVTVADKNGITEFDYVCDNEGITLFKLDANLKFSPNPVQKWMYIQKEKKLKLAGAESIFLRKKILHKLIPPNGAYEASMQDANYINEIYIFNRAQKLVKVTSDIEEATYAFEIKGKQIFMYFIDAKKKTTKVIFETWTFDEEEGLFFLTANGKKILKEKSIIPQKKSVNRALKNLFKYEI